MFAIILFLVQAQALTIPLPLPPTASFGGALTSSQGAFGFATSANGVNSASSAATGGLVNSGTIVSTGNQDPGSLSQPTPELSLPDLNRYVPDYRKGVNQPSQTSATTATKRKVKVRKYPTPAPAANPNVCWVISKKCCFEPVQKGYRCKDYYVYKYARCHPVVDYQQICGEIMEQPKEHPKPDGRVLYEESIIKNYDSRYGPHVQGYPEDGESEFYDTPVVPHRPHGVTADPYEPPVQYHGSTEGDAGGPQQQYPTNASGDSSGGSYDAGGASPAGNGYTGQPPPATESTGGHDGTGGPPVAAVDATTQSGGTYRLVEATE